MFFLRFLEPRRLPREILEAQESSQEAIKPQQKNIKKLIPHFAFFYNFLSNFGGHFRTQIQVKWGSIIKTFFGPILESIWRSVLQGVPPANAATP